MTKLAIEKELELPRSYFYSKTHSDRDWIKSRMSVIPEHRKHEVCKEYEKRYLSGRTSSLGRKNANTWLNGVAKEYVKGVA